MALYGNPYLPQSYQTPMNYTQTYPGGIVGVDGEAAARAYQMPPGIPPGVPIALWDTNGNTIYLKSMNPMGMPNPLQKLTYTREEPQMPAAQTSDYVTKADLEKLKQEILGEVKSDVKPAV